MWAHNYNDYFLSVEKVTTIDQLAKASVESVEQQEDGADANHRAQNYRVPPLAQIDFLDEAIDGGETVWGEGVVKENK